MSLSFAATARAHQADAVGAKAFFNSDGTYRLELSVDVIASSDPALNDEISPEEAAMDVANDVRLKFDEEEFAPEWTPIESMPVEGKEGVTRLITDTSGKVPPGTQQFFLHLGSEGQVALVMVAFKDGNMGRRPYIIYPGEYTPPIDLSFIELEVIEADPFQADNPPSTMSTFRSGVASPFVSGARPALAVLLLCLLSQGIRGCVRALLLFSAGVLASYFAVSLATDSTSPALQQGSSALAILGLAAMNLRPVKSPSLQNVGIALAGILTGAGLNLLPPGTGISHLLSFSMGLLVSFAGILLIAWISTEKLREQKEFEALAVRPASLILAGAALFWLVQATVAAL